MRSFARERWQGILEELANERGPWGQRRAPVPPTAPDATPSSASFWILDETLNQKNIRCKFKRNPRGTQHRVASSLTRGDERRGRRPTADKALDANVLESIVEEVGRNSGEIEWAATGLMKDLKKYQRRATMHVGAIEGLEDKEKAAGGGGGEGEGEVPAPEEGAGGRQRKGSKESSKDSSRGREKAEKGTGTILSVPLSLSSSTTTLPNSRTGGYAANSATTFNAYVFKNCYIVRTTGRTFGDLEIQNETIRFSAASDHLQEEIETREEMSSWSWVTEPLGSCSFPIGDLASMRFRRFQQQPLSLELMFTDFKTVILTFDTSKSCKEFHKVVRYTFRPPHLNAFLGVSPRQVILKTKASFNKKLVTKAWVSREITTFDYLIALNSVAGRSFSDLTQYPVFPWVLSNYTSETIDLRDPANYRDFEWPMGAQTEARREACRERYAGLQMCYDPNDQDCDTRDLMPPFHHGTHYSCPGFVIWCVRNQGCSHD